MKNNYRTLKQDIADEKKAIEESLASIDKIRKSARKIPQEYITAPALGTYLMNFYNGIENILKRICKQYYKTMPKGASWHKELLMLSCNPPKNKLAIFDSTLVEKIIPY